MTINTDVNEYISTYVNVCNIHNTYIHTYVHTYIHTYTHRQTYRHTYIHTCKHTYIHTYINTYIHKYIHTYIHTYTILIWFCVKTGMMDAYLFWCKWFFVNPRITLPCADGVYNPFMVACLTRLIIGFATLYRCFAEHFSLVFFSSARCVYRAQNNMR